MADDPDKRPRYGKSILELLNELPGEDGKPDRRPRAVKLFDEAYGLLGTQTVLGRLAEFLDVLPYRKVPLGELLLGQVPLGEAPGRVAPLARAYAFDQAHLKAQQLGIAASAISGYLDQLSHVTSSPTTSPGRRPGPRDPADDSPPGANETLTRLGLQAASTGLDLVANRGVPGMHEGLDALQGAFDGTNDGLRQLWPWYHAKPKPAAVPPPPDLRTLVQAPVLVPFSPIAPAPKLRPVRGPMLAPASAIDPLLARALLNAPRLTRRAPSRLPSVVPRPFQGRTGPVRATRVSTGAPPSRPAPTMFPPITILPRPRTTVPASPTPASRIRRGAVKPKARGQRTTTVRARGMSSFDVDMKIAHGQQLARGR